MGSSSHKSTSASPSKWSRMIRNFASNRTKFGLLFALGFAIVAAAVVGTILLTFGIAALGLPAIGVIMVATILASSAAGNKFGKFIFNKIRRYGKQRGERETQQTVLSSTASTLKTLDDAHDFDPSTSDAPSKKRVENSPENIITENFSNDSAECEPHHLRLT